MKVILDSAQIEQILKEIARECPVGGLKAAGVQVGVNAQGEKVSVLEVEKNERLQVLHEKVMREIK